MHDKAAADRLRREVQRQYETHRGEKFTKTGLAVATGIARPTLDNYLEHGLMPPVDAMGKIGDAVGVPATHLWVKWLDLGMSDPLDRIADALERAYPKVFTGPDDAALLAERVEAEGVAEARRRVPRPARTAPASPTPSPARPARAKSG